MKTINPSDLRRCNWCELPFESEPVYHEWDTKRTDPFCSAECLRAMDIQIRQFNNRIEKEPEDE